MKKLLTLILAISLILLTYSCTRNEDPDFGAERIYNCSQAQNYDSTTLASGLIGDWKWTIRTCVFQGAIKADKVVTIKFEHGGLYSLTENSIVTAQGNWNLKTIDNGQMYMLEIDQYVPYLQGRILLCKDDLIFNNSIVDACDHYFVRAK